MLRVWWKIPLCAVFAKFVIFQGGENGVQPFLRILRILLLGPKSEKPGRLTLPGPFLSKRASLPNVATGHFWGLAREGTPFEPSQEKQGVTHGPRCLA